MTAPVLDAPATPSAPSGWRGPLFPVNTKSGDGRIITLDEAATDVPCRPLPLPLCAQRHVGDGHDGAIVVGFINKVWLENGQVMGEGTFSPDPDGQEWAQRVNNGQRWVSVDLSDLVVEETPVDADGCEIDLTAAERMDAESTEVDCLWKVTGWKVMGATLVAGPAFEQAYIEPIDDAAPTGITAALTAALTAAGVTYAAADFDDPHLTELTALQVTDDGRVFGHLAGWSTRHLSFPGANITPPHSASSYAFFHQGVVRTDRGDLPVGKITLGTGHASTGRDIGAQAAAAHYDNTGTAVAVARCGEDRFGIWFAGRILPGTTDAKVDELRRSGLSGDWREIGNSLELVAALAVNTPGFPIPRALAASGALVAAGMVTESRARRAHDGRVSLSAAALRERIAHRRLAALRARVTTRDLASLRARVDARTKTRQLAALRARVDGRFGRVVRTQEGADLWGVPIGTEIPGPGEAAPAGGDPTAGSPVPADVMPLDAPGPAVDMSETGRMEEDQSPETSPDGAPMTAYQDGLAFYEDGSITDGESWYSSESLASGGDDGGGDDGPSDERIARAQRIQAALGEVEQTNGLPSDAEPIPDAPALAVEVDETGYMDEDMSPETGVAGGALVSYSDGVATYSDGTFTDGTTWYQSSQVQDALSKSGALDEGTE
ncbi:hypothetical protein TPB0596_12410 [Tsukamurella pulmonis]|uniref:hypothetical protein n=1 Tax=Tsukamurella pulmonis TaxID=47312 RepID=UPI001EE0C651|nr:hypothetical protein [Tsukamurella pulmonis]BDD81478.1 hypothetical protein TPB0596_12410 [Tsukamurella pulmonis]